MNFKVFFPIFVALMLAASQPLSAQTTGCVGVHVSQSWDCESSTSAATATPIGGTAPYTYMWSTGDTTQTVTGLTPGQYHITVTDAVGCLEVQACVVVTPLCCLWAQWESMPDGCQGLGTGTATIIEIGGGFPPYILTLPNGTTKVSNGTTPTIITGLTAGNYIVTITDSKGCSLDQWLEVGQTSGPNATVTLAQINCGQTTATATVNVNNGTAPYTYLWDNGTTTATANLNAGTHGVTVTDKNGCVATATTVVNLPQPPVVNLVVTNTTCGQENGTITANITGGVAPYTCLWSNGATTDDLNNVAPGSYTITVTGANGCTKVSFATILPSMGAQDTTICQVGCDSVLIYGVTYYQSTENSFIENINGCPRTVSIHAIVLTTGATITQNVSACYGTVVNVNGVNYANNETVTTTGTGTCPGQVVWNIQFSAKPDTFPTTPITVCGFVDTTFTYPVSYTGVNGCTNLVLLKSVHVNQVQQEIAWLNPIEQCGLLAKTDTLYKGVQFNSVTCTLTTTLQELVTNPIQQETTWGQQQIICGSNPQTIVVTDSIQTSTGDCQQTLYKHELVIIPYETDTTLGPVQMFCSTTQAQFFTFDSEETDNTNCKRTLFMHPVMTTAWQSTTIYSDPVSFCGDTTATFVNFDGRKVDTQNCRDTIFLHNIMVVKETQDTTWNQPQEICGFVTGTFVIEDSTQIEGCHTQVFAHKLIVKPLSVEEFIGDTITKCGINPNVILITDDTVTDTVNCTQHVYKHWEVTIPLLTKDVLNDTVYTCGITANSELFQDSTVIDSVNCLKKVYSHWVITYPIATSTFTETFCANNSYVWARNGKVYTEPGVYTDTTLTAEGCPDIATLYLAELPLAYSDTTVFVCPNGVFEYEGNGYGPGTEEEFVYVSNNGCDSIFLLKVMEIQNPITINFPGNVVLNVPTMSQEVIDNLVIATASGDTISLLGGIVTENLLKINDSLWVQTWTVTTPCDTLTRTRTITVHQPNIICDVLIQRTSNNLVNITVGDTGDPQNIRYELFSSNGRFVEKGKLNQGFNTLDFNHLSAGGYYLHIYADILIDGKRKLQILRDDQGRYSWCVTVIK